MSTNKMCVWDAFGDYSCGAGRPVPSAPFVGGAGPPGAAPVSFAGSSYTSAGSAARVGADMGKLREAFTSGAAEEHDEEVPASAAGREFFSAKDIMLPKELMRPKKIMGKAEGFCGCGATAPM